MYNKNFLIAFMTLCLLGCGNDEPAKTEDPKPDSPAPTYSITVTVNTFVGTLVLQNNGGDDLELTEEGIYSFSKELEDGEAYDVTVETNPDATFCTVENGSGEVDGADVINIDVHCIS